MNAMVTANVMLCIVTNTFVCVAPSIRNALTVRTACTMAPRFQNC
jgi:hypothetical protein